MNDVTLAFDNHVAVLTLNRPQSLNALSQAMVQSLDRRLDELGRFDALRAVIITGEGRAFSAGGDLIEFEQALQSGGSTLLDMMTYNQTVLQKVEDLPVPVIGAVNGTAVAGGLELLLCCDILIAAERVKIADGHARYAILPTAGATVRLRERLPASLANQLFFTAAPLEADILARHGLINEVVPAERLMPRALEIASEIGDRSPQAVRRIKSLLKAARTGERQAGFDAELSAFAEHMKGADLREGLDAFKNKRRPTYPATDDEAVPTSER